MQLIQPMKATMDAGGAAKAASGSGIAGGAAITAGVLSGITDIVTGYINAGRIKQTANFNAALGDIQVRLAKTAAKFEIARIREKADSAFSTQRAMYAKSGVTMAGSPSAVMTEGLKNSELDALITDYNADMAGNSIGVQGQIAQMEASGAYSAASVNAGKSILTMGTKFYTRG